jgi:geranyl-CoA carboxylase alpha subunit
MREAMGKDAVAAALAVGYRGAGTVEFIVDDKLRHYFLEMNTRLQVEHPVTECITGYDLVEWQLRVAAGEPLPARQSDITLTGHAIEARLYVEDPYAGFAPQTGTVLWWQPERALSAGVRIDAGIAQGSAISPYYDPMVAKVIVHGRDRHPPPARGADQYAATGSQEQLPLPERSGGPPGVSQGRNDHHVDRPMAGAGRASAAGSRTV